MSSFFLPAPLHCSSSETYHHHPAVKPPPFPFLLNVLIYKHTGGLEVLLLQVGSGSKATGEDLLVLHRKAQLREFPLVTLATLGGVVGHEEDPGGRVR